MVRINSVPARLLTLKIVLLLAAASAWGQRPAEEQLAGMQPAVDFEISLFASEPMITNPAAIDVDTQGRVWVAEIQWYRKGAKVPPQDKIKVLEDTDGDGRADKATVFCEGVFCPMSICVAGDKVYVATSPDLWVYEDKDGDLRADGPPKKLLTGFGGENHDHGAHSLVLGPDHKWWMAHGDSGFKVKGTDGSQIEHQWGAMIRGELDGSKLENVAVNFRNPYEICVSSFGESFCSDNDNDGLKSSRICWIMDGGNYGWFGRPPEPALPGTPFGEHWHFRGHLPGFVPATLCTGFGSPCGICFYEGDAFGPSYKNMPLHADAGPAEVRAYPHEIAGAGMKATSKVFLKSDDRYFRPDDICAAPDGTLFVADWYDGGVGGHAYNNPDQGRIFLLRPKGQKPQRREKAGPYANLDDAVEGLKSPNLATQFLARERLLADGEKSIPALVKLLDEPDANFRARALWVLDRIGGEGRQAVERQLQSDDPRMRALAVRILRRHGDQYVPAMLKLADDTSLEVVRELLLALRHVPSSTSDPVLLSIARRYDDSDRYFLEALNIALGNGDETGSDSRGNERRMAFYQLFAAQNEFSLNQFYLLQRLNPQAASEQLGKYLLGSPVQEDVARRLLLAAGISSSPEMGRQYLRILQNDSLPAELKRLALEQLAANLKGAWQSVASEEQLPALIGQLIDSESFQEPALKMIASLQLQEFGEKALAIALLPTTEQDRRVLAIQTIGELKSPGAVSHLRTLLKDANDAVRQAALTALVKLNDSKALREALTSNNRTFSLREQRRIADQLLRSTGGALILSEQLGGDKLSGPLKPYVLTKVVRHPDANVRAMFEPFLPEAQRPKRLGETITAKEILALKGDPSRGSEIFKQSTAAQCSSCHAVHGVGASIGPDLSLIGKKYERATLLETILEPSKAIAPEYVSYVAETEDGRIIVGFVVEKTDSEIVLKDAKGSLHRLEAKGVELTPQTKSAMPELVLRDVTAQDAADLLAFLMTLKE